MANTTLTQTGAQVQADLNLLDNNQATSGQVLTADGSGGCAWASPSGGGGTGYNGTIYLPYSACKAFVLHANGSCDFIDTTYDVSLTNVSLVILINTGREGLDMVSISNAYAFYQSKTGGYYNNVVGAMTNFATAFVCPYANNFDITLDD